MAHTRQAGVGLSKLLGLIPVQVAFILEWVELA